MKHAFLYDAIDSRGQRQRGSIEASNEGEARLTLKARGVVPLSLSSSRRVQTTVSRQATVPIRATAAPTANGALPAAPNLPAPSLPARELELLFSQLAKMVTAGLSIERALATVAQGAQGTPRSEVAARVVGAMRGGLSPSKAFGLDPRNFDQACLALLKSGELTGDLGAVLSEIERLMVARNALRSKVLTALVYPAILALVAMGSVLTILLVVVPQFEQLVSAHLDKLPTSARVVFWLSDTVRQLAVPIGLAIAVVFAMALRSARAGNFERAMIGMICLTKPGASLVEKAQSAALFRLLGTLLSRQVQLLPALDVARQTINDAALADAAQTVRDALKSGTRLSDALADTAKFPAIVVQLARVGEETGELASMLTKAAQMLEDELERMTKLFLIWFEPMLLLVIGGMIGGLLYGLFSAILSINSII